MHPGLDDAPLIRSDRLVLRTEMVRSNQVMPSADNAATMQCAQTECIRVVLSLTITNLIGLPSALRLSAFTQLGPLCDDAKSRPSRGRSRDLQAMPEDLCGLSRDVEINSMAVAGSVAHTVKQIEEFEASRRPKCRYRCRRCRRRDDIRRGCDLPHLCILPRYEPDFVELRRKASYRSEWKR